MVFALENTAFVGPEQQCAEEPSQMQQLVSSSTSAEVERWLSG